MDNLIDRLQLIVGDNGIISGPDLTERAVPYWDPSPTEARMLVRPQTTQQVSEVFRFMKMSRTVFSIILITALFACSKKEEQADTFPADEVEIVEPKVAQVMVAIPGLELKVLRTGEGSAAGPGEEVEVHYTGWINDSQSENGRGKRFDSSVDRGERYRFPLGEGRVIKGWDLGIEGMLVGEIRELKIAPELAYGDEGAGDVIPPGATLIFEVELFKISTAEQ